MEDGFQEREESFSGFGISKDPWKRSLAWSAGTRTVPEVKKQRKDTQTGLHCSVGQPCALRMPLPPPPSLGSSPLFELLILSCVPLVFVMTLE